MGPEGLDQKRFTYSQFSIDRNNQVVEAGGSSDQLRYWNSLAIGKKLESTHNPKNEEGIDW
jgi:hypothetical protein